MTDKAISPLRRRLIEDMTIRRLSPKTHYQYIRHVKRFADFLGRSADKATAADVHRYQLWLASIGASVGTANVSATALRFFFKVTLKRHDLAEELISTREPRRLPVVLSSQEVGRLLASATNIKHRAILSLAYATGLRASEVVSLKLTDIDRDRMLIRVEQGKGKKDRYVILSPILLEILHEWWRVARKKGWMSAGQPWLFPGYRGQHTSARQLHRIVRLAAGRAGITKRVGVHTLRHCFATHLLEQKTDIRIIQVERNGFAVGERRGMGGWGGYRLRRDGMVLCSMTKEQTMSPLRARMIEDMKLAGLAPTTQEIYLQAVRSLAKHYHRSPELLAEEEVRRYLLDVRERNARGSFKTSHYGIQFFYRNTLSKDWALFKKRFGLPSDRGHEAGWLSADDPGDLPPGGQVSSE